MGSIMDDCVYKFSDSIKQVKASQRGLIAEENCWERTIDLLFQENKVYCSHIIWWDAFLNVPCQILFTLNWKF